MRWQWQLLSDKKKIIVMKREIEDFFREEENRIRADDTQAVREEGAVSSFRRLAVLAHFVKEYPQEDMAYAD